MQQSSDISRTQPSAGFKVFAICADKPFRSVAIASTVSGSWWGGEKESQAWGGARYLMVSICGIYGIGPLSMVSIYGILGIDLRYLGIYLRYLRYLSTVSMVSIYGTNLRYIWYRSTVSTSTVSMVSTSTVSKVRHLWYHIDLYTAFIYDIATYTHAFRNDAF